ncbi:MAG TPA: tetratricopeptide repeat protein, partial [Chloroflexi bacterium]|nr:tetratricopeptide repeat protein [Chloroflexota bacterium]
MAARRGKSWTSRRSPRAPPSRRRGAGIVSRACYDSCMELKPARSSYRRRQRSVFWRVLILLALVFIGGYIVYNSWWTETGPLPLSNTPTLAPTPTRSAVVWSASGDELYWSGNVSEAIVAYSEALALDPDQPALYVRLARLLTIFGRPERGLEMARAALRYNSEDPTAWVALCMAYDWLGFAQEAIPHCQRAVNLDPTYAEAYAYLAEAYIDDGQWFNANETIQIALTLDPNSVDVLRNYGYVLELQGNYTAALAAYQEGLLYHPGMAHLHLAIGRNAQVLGNYALAEESFLAATELDPGNAAAWDLLAWLYLLS